MNSINDYKNRVIIFAHPRSGSTSLYKILNTHPVLNLSCEPFHPGYCQWNPDEKNYLEITKDIPSLELVLNELFRKYNGMKVLSYQLPEEIYNHLLSIKDCKIIFLTRTNILKAIVSVLIAEQTGVWQKNDLNQKTNDKYHRMQPLKIDGIDGIENRIKEHKAHTEYWKRIFSQKPATSYSDITYEELFCEGIERSFITINSIFKFLGLEMPEYDKIARYINPGYEQINSYDTYKLVPNICEINSRFGNDENGFLF